MSTMQEKPRRVPVTVRVPEELLAKVDRAISKRPVHIPRHTWLLEAVVEKIQREGARSGDSHGEK